MDDTAVVVGTTFKAAAVVEPENTDKALVWSSSNEDIIRTYSSCYKTEKRAITAITISTIAIGDSLVLVFAVPFELLSFSLCIFISILKLSHQEASIALPDTYNLPPSV